MSEDEYLDPEGEDDGCRQLLQVSGDAADVRAFRKELEETERWGTELDHFLKFGDFDAVPEHLFDDSARTMGRLCAFLRERWGDYADSSHPVLIVAESDGAVTYEFYTSRTPLLGLTRMLSEEYPKLRFALEYAYPDGGGYDGKVIYEKGEMADGLEETYEYMSHSDFEEFAGFDLRSGTLAVVCQSRGGGRSVIPDVKAGRWDLSFAVETALKWGQAAVSFFVFHHEAYTCDIETYKGMDSFVTTVGFERTVLGEPARPVAVGLLDESLGQHPPGVRRGDRRNGASGAAHRARLGRFPDGARAVRSPRRSVLARRPAQAALLSRCFAQGGGHRVRQRARRCRQGLPALAAAHEGRQGLHVPGVQDPPLKPGVQSFGRFFSRRFRNTFISFAACWSPLASATAMPSVQASAAAVN